MGKLVRTLNYIRERIADPKEFDRRSFRTVRTDGHRVVIGCPNGRWDSAHDVCEVGTRAQSVLHPASEGQKLAARHGHRIARKAEGSK